MPFIYLTHQEPSFNINSIKGWDTRLLYCYYGTPVGNMDYLIESKGSYTENLFEIIELNTTNWKGNYSFSNFFSSGKNLRIKGRFYVSCETTERRFNIFFRISGTYVSSTNNNNNHNFANNLDPKNVPVDFELIITSIADNDEKFSVQANGFYQYNYSDYNQEGTNLGNVYVPIWNSLMWVGTFSKDTQSLQLSFDNSTVNEIIVSYITIEELT